MIAAFRSRIRLSRGLALTLVVCALLARAFVPQGWMASPGASGWQITLCGGTGPMAMPAPIAEAMKGVHHDSGQSDHGASDHPCAFSGLAMAFDAPPSLAIDLPKPALDSWSAGFAIIVTIGRGLAAPPPPPTGPPSI